MEYTIILLINIFNQISVTFSDRFLQLKTTTHEFTKLHLVTQTAK